MTPALDNARAALHQLQSFLATPALSDRDRAGVIQAFEFTFETVWKLFKHIAEAEGLEAPSPKRALIAAHKLGLVEDELLWLDMLRDRNLTSHVYHSDFAISIFEAIQSRYAPALADGVLRAESAAGHPAAH
jgi:nucleotidyltransferase substrate binding protein (TIGR01987 family)